MIPDESSESCELGESVHPSDNQSNNHESDKEAEEGDSPASADINLNDSNVSQSDASEDDDDTVVVTSSS